MKNEMIKITASTLIEARKADKWNRLMAENDQDEAYVIEIMRLHGCRVVSDFA